MLRIVVALLLVIGCGSKKPPGRSNPPLTHEALRTSICNKCDGRTSYCDLLVGTGAAGGTPVTTGGCERLPKECRGETSCDCFPALKGCRCEHTSRGFDVECPAP